MEEGGKTFTLISYLGWGWPVVGRGRGISLLLLLYPPVNGRQDLVGVFRVGHDKEDLYVVLTLGRGHPHALLGRPLHRHPGPDLGVEDNAQTTLCPHYCRGGNGNGFISKTDIMLGKNENKSLSHKSPEC